MRKHRQEVMCQDCGGTGEFEIEPGGDGYAPIIDSCPTCDGEGIEIIDHELILEYV